MEKKRSFPLSSTPVDQLYEALQSSPLGLSEAIAVERLRDQLRSTKHRSVANRKLNLFLRQFANPLILLLVVAAVLSLVIGESSDSFIILFILLSAAVLGFWQEWNAGRAMERLQQMVATKHTVIRDGRKVQVYSAEIVTGDLLSLDAGDLIPADCRITASNELHVNESSLTGESYPVEKMTGQTEDNIPVSKKYNCLWQGTSVVSGTASAIAVETGNSTILGRMAHSLAENSETAFQKGIRKFGYFLLKITVILAISILVINLYFGKPLFDSVLFSLALAVGMAPELLPAIMTFAMSVGARRMSRKKVVVKKLSSIFNFGEVDLLCTDKTGTITEGNARVRDIVDADGISSEKLRIYAYLNSSFQEGFDNPIDQAIALLKMPVGNYCKTGEIPYDFIRKRLTVSFEKDGSFFFVTKGAFRNVFDNCTQIEYQDGRLWPLDDTLRKKAEDSYVSYSEQGFRVLGLACKITSDKKILRDDEQNMIFLGFILLEDPLKEYTLASIQRLNKLLVKIKIITGDNRYAAMYTAKQIGILQPVMLTGEDLGLLTAEALVIKAGVTDIFAEIEPQQKERIIKALQKAGNIVAYMGDGINDVAAINAADIGISANNAVDVAREAADFVLLEKDLSVLADGIYEGRRSFTNSMKYILITTGATFGNMFSVAGASLFLPFLPMLPKQILLTNFITDFPFLTIASDEVDKDQLARPGKWNLKMIRQFMIVFGLHSSLFDFITFYILYYHFRLSGSPFQTGWFLESAITELMILFIMRTRKPFLKSMPGKLLLISGLFAMICTIWLPFSPFAGMLGLSVAHGWEVITILLILVAYVITADLLKIVFFRSLEKRIKAGP